MRGLLAAAGYGTRLWSITENLPKCLVPIAGKPLLIQWLEKLSKLDIAPILINAHHHAAQVVTSIKESNFGDLVNVVFEEELLGTAGTIARNAEFLTGDAVFFAHADNYCLSDLSKLIDAHKARPPGVEISMLTFLTDQPEQCGIVEVDKRGIVTRLSEKTPNVDGRIANGAVFVISQSVVGEIKQQSDKLFDFSKDVIPRYINRILTVPADGAHIDVGTYENLVKARSLGLEMARERGRD